MALCKAYALLRHCIKVWCAVRLPTVELRDLVAIIVCEYKNNIRFFGWRQHKERERLILFSTALHNHHQAKSRNNDMAYFVGISAATLNSSHDKNYSRMKNAHAYNMKILKLNSQNAVNSAARILSRRCFFRSRLK